MRLTNILFFLISGFALGISSCSVEQRIYKPRQHIKRFERNTNEDESMKKDADFSLDFEEVKKENKIQNSVENDSITQIYKPNLEQVNTVDSSSSDHFELEEKNGSNLLSQIKLTDNSINKTILESRVLKKGKKSLEHEKVSMNQKDNSKRFEMNFLDWKTLALVFGFLFLMVGLVALITLSNVGYIFLLSGILLLLSSLL